MSGPIDHDRLARVRLIAFDVDGVFTDGRLYISDDGSESKAFHTQDGFGIRCLIDAGFDVAVISGRDSAAVAQRMNDLSVQHVIQGCHDKVAAFDQILAELGLTPQQSAFVGDDVPDLPLLQHAGVSFAVANAVKAVRDHCDYTTRTSGGWGAVREICDLICQGRQQ